MSQSPTLTDEQRVVVDKVEKLLRLAGKNPSEAEVAAANAKAMELLAAYNLSLGSVDASLDGSGKRAAELRQGGFYEYERDLWARIAEINFCIYFTTHEWGRRRANGPRRLKRHHKLVGRVVNIRATEVMADYVLGAIERLTRERLKGRMVDGESMAGALRSRWAVSYREGIAHRVAMKLWDRRQDQLAAERKAQEEAEARAAMAGTSVETAVTLASVVQSERDANHDFLYGEGFSARYAAERARQAKAKAEAEAEYTAWAAANPEAARKEERKREKERVRLARTSRQGRADPRDNRRDWGAYRAGYAAGESVGIDPQASGGKSAGSLS